MAFRHQGMVQHYGKMHPRIIVADDEPANRELLREILLSCIPQAEVETVSDGLDLVSRMAHYEFDLVLTDNKMPILDGSGVIQAIRAYGNQTPMFLVSGDENLPLIAESAGADGYLQKGEGLHLGIERITAKYFK